MNIPMVVIIGLGAGAGLGWFYFQGLWVTVARLPTLQRPGLWMAGSLLLRLLLVLGGFVWLGRSGGWAALVSGLVGFVSARTALVKSLRSAAIKSGASQ